MLFERRATGLTLIELVITIAIIGILTGISVPAFTNWMHHFRLKRAARDLYSCMQYTKMGAIRNNKDWAIIFRPESDRYFVCTDRGPDERWSTLGDNRVLRIVNLAHYGSGVRYGPGFAVRAATVSGGNLPVDHISYNGNVVSFNPMGTGSAGYVYLQNELNNGYVVGTRGTGIILIRRWFPSGWD